eukprot:8792108-Heterocapsa_arctica.AAC.1
MPLGMRAPAPSGRQQPTPCDPGRRPCSRGSPHYLACGQNGVHGWISCLPQRLAYAQGGLR